MRFDLSQRSEVLSAILETTFQTQVGYLCSMQALGLQLILRANPYKLDTILNSNKKQVTGIIAREETIALSILYCTHCIYS